MRHSEEWRWFSDVFSTTTTALSSLPRQLFWANTFFYGICMCGGWCCCHWAQISWNGCIFIYLYVFFCLGCKQNGKHTCWDMRIQDVCEYKLQRVLDFLLWLNPLWKRGEAMPTYKADDDVICGWLPETGLYIWEFRCSCVDIIGTWWQTVTMHVSGLGVMGERCRWDKAIVK